MPAVDVDVLTFTCGRFGRTGPAPRELLATRMAGRDRNRSALLAAQALSAAFCRTVSQPGRYCDGNGLYLHVEPSGARRWVQRLVIHGKAHALGLGSFHLVPLAQAREQALANRRVPRSGGDPRAASRRRANGRPTRGRTCSSAAAG